MLELPQLFTELPQRPLIDVRQSPLRFPRDLKHCLGPHVGVIDIYILYKHNYDLRFGECGPWAYLRLTRKSFAKFPGPFPQFAYLPGGGRSWNWMQVSKFHRSLDACRPARNRTRQVTLGWLGVGFVAGCWSFRASNFTRKVWSRHDLFDSM